VRRGGLTDSGAERYLIQTLIERRNKFGRYYFDQMLALDGFTVDGNTVRFADLPTQHGFAGQSENYTVSWFRFDNAKNEKTSVGSEITVTDRTFAVPSELLRDGSPYFGVEIRHSARRELKGEPYVSLFMHRLSSGRIVGIDRTWREK
jgi:hypothetical protein